MEGGRQYVCVCVFIGHQKCCKMSITFTFASYMMHNFYFKMAHLFIKADVKRPLNFDTLMANQLECTSLMY